MASSGSSLESTRPHSRRDHRRSSRSRDTRPQVEEPDYGDDKITPLPSTNPPPGTEIARGIPDPPPHSDPTAGDCSQHNIPTSTPPQTLGLLSLVHNPIHLFLPLHPHILPFHSSHHHASKHHAHGLHFLTHVPRAHRPSIHMQHDHTPDNLLTATIAHHERHVRHSHDTMIDDVRPGAALPTLADTVDIDTAHLQHHAPDGTTVTVAAHILGDAALAHTKEGPRSIVAHPTVPDLVIPAIIATDHGQTKQQLFMPLRTAHLFRLLPPFMLLPTGILRWLLL